MVTSGDSGGHACPRQALDRIGQNVMARWLLAVVVMMMMMVMRRLELGARIIISGQDHVGWKRPRSEDGSSHQRSKHQPGLVVNSGPVAPGTSSDRPPWCDEESGFWIFCSWWKVSECM